MYRVSVCGLLLSLMACAPLRGDVLEVIAPSGVVCIGNQAPDKERQAARLIFRALRERSDSALLLSDEQVLATPVSISGNWHIIAVGRATTNSVLLNYPSYWGLDRELYYAPLGNMPAAPFTETRGFYVGGFGYFFAGRNVGFVEFDRSPFHSRMVLSLPDKSQASTEMALPLRFLIRVTGSTPEGVLLAAERFIEGRMVYGLAIGPPRWPRSHDLWNLDDEYIKPDPPPWIPKGTFVGSGAKGERLTVSYLGWLMADRTMYAGFLEITGCKPVQMWRAKYVTEVGLLDFHRSPQHRASANELLVVKLASPEELPKAVKSLGGNIPVNIAGEIWYKTNRVYESDRSSTTLANRPKPTETRALSSTHILPATISKEPYLIVANFDGEHATMILPAVVGSLPKEE